MTYRGGSANPSTVTKSERFYEIARQNRLPVINLNESAGADLPRQADIFVRGGAQFKHLTQLSQAGIPTITVAFGPNTAGGAYVPGMSDYTVFVAGRGTAYLGGPPLVKMAIDEIVDEGGHSFIGVEGDGCRPRHLGEVAAVDRQLEIGSRHREGVAQLVGGVVDQAPLVLEGGLQAVDHVVEGVGELLEFVVWPTQTDPPRQVVGRDVPGDGDHLGDRAERPARHDPAGCEAGDGEQTEGVERRPTELIEGVSIGVLLDADRHGDLQVFGEHELIDGLEFSAADRVDVGDLSGLDHRRLEPVDLPQVDRADEECTDGEHRHRHRQREAEPDRRREASQPRRPRRFRRRRRHRRFSRQSGSPRRSRSRSAGRDALPPACDAGSPPSPAPCW